MINRLMKIIVTKCCTLHVCRSYIAADYELNGL